MRKVLALIVLVSTVLVMCLSGCSSSPAQTAATTTQATKSQAAVDNGPVTPGGQFPIVKDKLTLNCFYVPKSYVQDISTNDATVWLEKKTNIHINWTTVSDEDGSTKFTLLLSSGDVPDIMMPIYATSAEVLNAYGEQGILLPLNDLIDKYGVNIKHVWDEIGNNAQKQCQADNGKNYFLAEYSTGFHSSAGQKLWMDYKWLGNLGLKPPTTTDEFYNLLKTVKEKDANGNGKPNDEIPFTYISDGWCTEAPDFIMNSFVYSSPNMGYRYVDNGKVYVSYYEPGWREGLKYLNKLYAEGLMDKEAFVIKVEQIRTLSGSPDGNTVFSFAGGTASSGVSMNNPQIFDYHSIEPLTGPTGLKQTPSDPIAQDPGFCISAKTKYPEAAFRWGDALEYDLCDMLAKDDYEWMNFAYGPEGKGWRKANSGELGISGKPAKYAWLFNWGDQMNMHWYENFINYMPMDYKDYMAVSATKGAYDQEKVLYDETMANYDKYRVSKQMPYVALSTDVTSEFAEIETNLLTYVKEAMSKFVTGELNPSNDNDWNGYLSQLKTIGIDKYIQISQDALDR